MKRLVQLPVAASFTSDSARNFREGTSRRLLRELYERESNVQKTSLIHGMAGIVYKNVDDVLISEIKPRVLPEKIVSI